jgi:hypothetical protein
MCEEVFVEAPVRAREDLALERDNRADRQFARVEATVACSSAAPINRSCSIQSASSSSTRSGRRNGATR